MEMEDFQKIIDEDAKIFDSRNEDEGGTGSSGTTNEEGHSDAAQSERERNEMKAAETILRSIAEHIAEAKASVESGAGASGEAEGAHNENTQRSEASHNAKVHDKLFEQSERSVDHLLKMMGILNAVKEEDAAVNQDRKDYQAYMKAEMDSVQDILNGRDGGWSTDLFRVLDNLKAIGGEQQLGTRIINILTPILQLIVNQLRAELKVKDIMIAQSDAQMKLMQRVQDVAEKRLEWVELIVNGMDDKVKRQVEQSNEKHRQGVDVLQGNLSDFDARLKVLEAERNTASAKAETEAKARSTDALKNLAADCKEMLAKLDTVCNKINEVSEDIKVLESRFATEETTPAIFELKKKVICLNQDVKVLFDNRKISEVVAKIDTTRGTIQQLVTYNNRSNVVDKTLKELDDTVKILKDGSKAAMDQMEATNKSADARNIDMDKKFKSLMSTLR